MNAKQKAFAEAQARAKLVADWLKTLMLPGHPKPATKEELFAWARANLGVNRTNFDSGWIDAIEAMGRHDWYEPSPRRKAKSS